MRLHALFLLPAVTTAVHLCLLGRPSPVLKSLLETATSNWQLFSDLTVFDKCPTDITGWNTINLNAENPEHPGLTRFRSGGVIQVEIDSRTLEYAGNIYNTILHELGHVLGLKHPDPPDQSIMSYYLSYHTSPGEFLPDPYRPIQPYVWPLFYSNRSVNADLGSKLG